MVLDTNLELTTVIRRQSVDVYRFCVDIASTVYYGIIIPLFQYPII